MHVLVTGGAGYVGSTLVPHLLASGAGVTVLDSADDGAPGLASCVDNPAFRLVKGDVADETALRIALADADVIVHLAALVGHPACDVDGDAALHSNVTTVERLLELREPTQHFVCSSTESVYGSVPGTLRTEDLACNPTSWYGVTKLRAERLALAQPNVTVLRFPSAFGLSPRQRWDLLVHDFVKRALSVGRVELFEAEVQRSFLHVKDMARSIVFVLAHPDETEGQIFNVGDDALNATKADIVKAIELELGLSVEVTRSLSKRDADSRDSTMSFEKLGRLGFAASKQLPDGIREVGRAVAMEAPR